MTARAIAPELSPACAIALAGTWKLARGRALTLRPTQPGILRVAHGRLWATRQGPHGGTPSDAGDHMLEAGRSMVLRRGERVVIEAWTPGGAAYFAWDPLLETAPVAAAQRRLDLALVRQPLADLRQAAVLGLHAVAALARGLAQLGLDALRGAGRAAPARRTPGLAG